MSDNVVIPDASPIEQTDSTKTEITTPIEQQAEARRLHKLKVNGKELELDDEKLKYHASKGLAADEKFQAAAKKEKLIQEVTEGLKTPKQFFSALEKLGMTKAQARETLEEVLRSEYEYEDMSPEEKQRRQEKEELEQYKREKAAMEAKAQEEQLTRQQQEDMAELEGEMVEALTQSSLPRSELFAKAAFNYMAAAASKDIDLSAAEAVKLVESDFTENIRTSLSNLDAKGIKSLLGEKVVQALLKDSVAEVRAKETPFVKSEPRVTNQAVSQSQTEGKKGNARPAYEDFFKNTRGF